MTLAATLDSFLDQLRWMVWTRALPALILAMLAGLTLRWLMDRLARGAARWWLQRATRPAAVSPDGTLAAVVTNSTPSTPACPACAGPMVRRTARRGVNAGQGFWGCSGYPACRGTRPCG